MNILILHKMPYDMVEYHRGIDHAQHDVTYIGTSTALENIPQNLRCKRLERPDDGPVHEEVINVLQDLRGRKFDRVLSVSEYELIDAARVRERFSIPGPRVHEVMLVRDKVAMKSAVAAAGLRVPRFMPLAAAVEPSACIPWQGRTVLKPVDGAKSKDVLVFGSPQDACNSVRDRRSGIQQLDCDRPDLARFEVEEFIDGPILHFDGIICDGELLFIVESCYIGTLLDYCGGAPVASYQRKLKKSICRWAQAVVRAVGITVGTFHLEAIENTGGLTFLEIANRCGGGEIGAAVELATGVHLPSSELAVHTVGKVDFGPGHGALRLYCGWFAFPGHHMDNRNWSVSNEESFRDSPHVVSWTQLMAGAPLPTDVNYYAGKAPLAGVVKASSPDKLREFLTALLATVRVC